MDGFFVLVLRYTSFKCYAVFFFRWNTDVGDWRHLYSVMFEIQDSRTRAQVFSCLLNLPDICMMVNIHGHKNSLDTGGRGWQMIFRHQTSIRTVTLHVEKTEIRRLVLCQISMLRDFATLEQRCTKMWGCHRKRRKKQPGKGKRLHTKASFLMGWCKLFFLVFVCSGQRRGFLRGSFLLL